MICPFCESQLVAEVHAGIEIDRCEECGGLWFDRDELAAYRKADGKNDHHELVSVVCREEPCLSCPRCRSETLVAVEVAGVEARRCSNCSGIAIQSKSVPSIARRLSKTAGDMALESATWEPELVTEGAGSMIELVLEFVAGFVDF